MSNLPLIADIKRHSLEDGPGIRTVVFFKGCPLRCVFCHNPQMQEAAVEIAFSAEDCIQCAACEDACPNGAIDLALPGRIHRATCLRCGKCADACPGSGLRLIGAYYSVEALTDILLRDLPYYTHSGGGVTLSGGECTIFPDYVQSLLRSLKMHAIHTALETSGYFDYETFKRKILPYIDLIYYDLKIADPTAHARHLGRPNQRILDNLRRLLREDSVEVRPRIPIIPGITDARENLTAIIDILSEAGAPDVSLLPYNPMGSDMAVRIGRPRPTLPQRFMDPEEERRIYSWFSDMLDRRQRVRAM